MEKIQFLSIDIETYCSTDLKTHGLYRYAQAEDFEILLLGYSVNGREVRTIDIASGEIIPDSILKAIVDDTVTKWAHNASFERICLSTWIKRKYPELFCGYKSGDEYFDYLNPVSWKCTMVWSAYLGLPLSLEGVGKILKLEDQKKQEGKSLIHYFCVPCRPTRINGGRSRNYPYHDLAKWNTFKEYNVRDVEVEMAIQNRLSHHPVPESVWEEYQLDQIINDRGIRIDMQLVENAIKFDEKSRSSISDKMYSLTKLDNPNSVAQLKTWLKDNGIKVDSLGKKNVTSLISESQGEIREALELRLQSAKSSIRKYQAMTDNICDDGRARGMFQFYGANRTGRWAGRQIQIHNLPQNHLEDLEGARAIVRSGDYELFSMLYDDIPDTLSQLIRTAFIPREGYKFIVSDFSAIEARVLSHLAGEQWRIDVFKNDGDIYCASASEMFKVPVEKHGQNGHLRQKGKQAELACIAKGQLVLTNHGLIPIENVTLSDRLWDGENWVEHDGVVYRGKKQVITYEGLTATNDHKVYIQGNAQPVDFNFAASSGSHLIQAERCGKAVRLDENNRYEIAMKIVSNSESVDVYDILNTGRNHRFTVSGKLVHNCGYGGGVGALKAMGAIESGLKEEELQPLVTSWRVANPNIVSFWWEVDAAVRKVIRDHSCDYVRDLTFEYRNGMMFVHLPSGRMLSYVKPRLEFDENGNEVITYEGVGTAKKWERIESYGPKFVENITQAISRDILAYAMRTLQSLRIVAHVHDELIIECPADMKTEDICNKMGITPPWISGLCLRADGDDMAFYQKS